ncbi:lipopolysaccharide biosynthesis protein [Novosphingobium album (ex Hu et al. 2023)]|uniref:Oligosaccharide flippase family protein n=1 Tax=Novosphingobium album (ex Hu et al. 2023) TaxID=2930093 RepID=A0ABT0B4R0_9SPHN|nr:oligosaccharide flippase family protein [Novosphingobium album (ex Hu et al. 2023)]MCJ2180072.1 oligosaccharide flippase family protein [Novosphingobium album (ex Hu et al. 2023)]
MIAKLKQHFQPLAALAIRGSSVLAGFFVTFYIGRTLGPQANGVYGLVTQTAMFLSVIAVGGLDMASVRELSRTVALRTSIDRYTYVRVVGWSMLIALAISCVLLLGGHKVSHLLMKSDQSFSMTVLLAVIFVSRTLTRIMSAILRSQKSFIFGQSIEVLFIPVAVSLVLLTGTLRSVEQILTFTALAGIITGAGAVLAGLRYTVSDGTGLRIPFRDLLKVALPLWSVAIALNIADWYSLVTVAGVLGVYEAGLYRVAYQVSSVLSIITVGLYSVFSARISAARAAGDLKRIALLGRSATRLSLAFAAPVLLTMFVFAPQILQLVGDEFVAGVPVLRIMAVVQAIYVATGPCGLTLAMCGQERTNLAITLTSLAFLLIFAPLSARWGGLAGVSVFIGLTMAARNVASFVAVRHLTGINIITGQVKPVTRKIVL